MSNYRFIGTLHKGHVNYYFEIKEPEVGFTADTRIAYIEKNTTLSASESGAFGHFTLDEARRCYKALLNKGFVLCTDEFNHYR